MVMLREQCQRLSLFNRRTAYWCALLFILANTLFSDLAAAQPSCFVNFGKQQCDAFELRPGVIIKTMLSKAQLQQQLDRPVTQLAMLGGAGLYLVASDRPLADAEQFSRIPEIEYAQPDVVQPRVLHTTDFEPDDITAMLPEGLAALGGEGISIAIIDDGFNLDHEDLRGVPVGFMYDADVKQIGAEPKAGIDQHGTMVAGVIAAQHNEKGINGVAPKAKLIPIRQVSTRTSDTVLSFTVADLAGADIINCSWNSRFLMQPVYDVIQSLVLRGRNGKGTAIIFAAGNEGRELFPLSKEAAIKEVITVGSLEKSSVATYSNYGALVDLFVPGHLRTTYRQGYGWFNGTSASAALASGVAALVLARNPDMALGELRSSLIQTTAELWPMPQSQSLILSELSGVPAL